MFFYIIGVNTSISQLLVQQYMYFKYSMLCLTLCIRWVLY